MLPTKTKVRSLGPRRDPIQKEVTKAPKVVLNFDAQDDVYVVNATDFGSELLAVRYSSDSKMVVVGGALGNLRAIRPNTHEVIATYQHSKNGSLSLDDPITCIREHPSSTPGAILMMATSARGHIQCWDLTDLTHGKPKFVLEEPRQCLGLAVSADNFITTGDDGVLYVYDTVTNKPIAKLESSPAGDKLDGHSSRSFAAAFHPGNPKEAISGGWDDCIHFWDIRQKHSLRRVGSAHICGSDALDFTPDGKQILAGAYQKSSQLQMLDYATGNLIRTVETDRFPTSLYAAVHLSDSVICAGGSDPNLFRAVNLHQKATIGLVKGMAGGVSSIHKAGSQLKFRAKPTLNKGRDRPKEKSGIPRVAFSAGHYLFEVEFY